MSQIYSSPTYAMGDVDAPVPQARAKASLKAMQRNLKGWLKYRKIMNDYIAGKREAPKVFLAPGVKPLPRATLAATLAAERYADDQDLATKLYSLLTECGMDPASLPNPDVAQDPNAALKLATIAVRGKTPDEVPSAQAQGIVWFVLLIPVAGAVFVLSQYISSKAEVEKEKERLRCVQAGACTDSGFWLKIASVAVLGWLAWDKFGLREAAAKGRRKLGQ